jgi:hypothetical protein
MYQIDKTTNTVKKLEERLFSELNIKERENLQEWIANNPEMLGEELLIIQKEFAGFNDTNERLDLLAVDKYGGLVIIENKLDDTGRDVVWQALKYTSYCSTLTTNQIIKIYQDYLDKWHNGENAKENLLDFVEREEDDLLLNKDDQRIMFVANNYRKEVTSTVLWLLNHNVQIQCFRAKPYSMGSDMFLQVEQIIPLPETKEFMIDAMQKDNEEKHKTKAIAETNQRLIKFWTEVKLAFEKEGIRWFANVTPRADYYLGFGKGAGSFVLCLGYKGNRVEFNIPNDRDKSLINRLYSKKEQIEEKLPMHPLVWENETGRVSSKVKIDMPAEEYANISRLKDEDYQELRIKWFLTTMIDFYNAVYPVWSKI